MILTDDGVLQGANRATKAKLPTVPMNRSAGSQNHRETKSDKRCHGSPLILSASPLRPSDTMIAAVGAAQVCSEATAYKRERADALTLANVFGQSRLTGRLTQGPMIPNLLPIKRSFDDASRHNAG